jgi:AP-2 complex subunit beta-1
MYFTPQSPGDAEMIAERIAPRLQHANSGVVLTTIKVILYLTNYMTKDEDITSLCRKLSPPLGNSFQTLLTFSLSDSII